MPEKSSTGAGVGELLKRLVTNGGSDLHLSSGSPPIIRLHGRLTPLPIPPLSEDDLGDILEFVLTEEQRQRFSSAFDLDFVLQLDGVGRFRGNAFVQHRGVGIVFRVIPERIPTTEELGLPPVIQDFTEMQKGMVLFTGPAGVGKSTTMAALINRINDQRADHIITIEDPIEFVHTNKKGLVHQREVGAHTQSFAAALRAALREDPDVILVGELRDSETIAIALTAAETGHLVLGTMHTTTAAKSVDRMIDSFHAEQQDQVRSMLAESLRGVVAQQLLRKADGSGRVVAFEILVNNPAIANLIREGKTFQIPSVIQTGRKAGMTLMDQSIIDLMEAGVVGGEEAYLHLQDKSLLTRSDEAVPRTSF